MSDEEAQAVEIQQQDDETGAGAGVEHAAVDGEEDLGEDISPEQNGGLYKKIVREGSGTNRAPEGSDVFVHYVGSLKDGTVFDSSREREAEFSFKLGQGKVIKGWDIGVKTMKKGEISILTCSSEYGYGVQGAPPKIPPNSQLTFEVELLRWKGEDITEDGGVEKAIVRKGDGFQTPNYGSDITAHIVGRCDDRVFEDRKVEFKMGDGEDHGVVEGVELAMEKMNMGERAEVTVKPTYGYGEKGSEEHGIPPNATLQYDIEMSTFNKARDEWSLSLSEKVELAKQAKDKGTGFFKNGRLKRALKEYQRILKILDNDNVQGDDAEAGKAVRVIGHLNIAACHLKFGEHFEAAKSCDKALGIDKDNVKAYFRRGQARIGLQDFDDAKSDFQEVLNREPRSKAARDQISVTNKLMQQMKAKEKKLYANMFEKLAIRDERAPHQLSDLEKEEAVDDTQSRGDKPKEDESSPESSSQEEGEIAVADGEQEETIAKEEGKEEAEDH